MMLLETALQVGDSGRQSYLNQHPRSTTQVKNPIWKGARSTIQVNNMIGDSIPGQRFRSTLLSEPAFKSAIQVHDPIWEKCQVNDSTIQVNNSLWNSVAGQRFRSTILSQPSFQVNNSGQKILFEKVQGQRYRSTILFEITLQVNDSGQQSYLNQHFRSTNRGQRFY